MARASEPERPIVGNWYARQDDGRRFEVIDFDRGEDNIDIQYADGRMEALNLHEWNALAPHIAEEPDDWACDMDDLEEDDYRRSETP